MFNSMEDLYKSEEWKSLEEINRAQLLLVIEGLKKGTCIYGYWNSFMDVLKKTGLDYQLNKSKYHLDPFVIVAKPEDLQERNRRYLTLSEVANGNELDKIDGWLFGYPKCGSIG